MLGQSALAQHHPFLRATLSGPIGLRLRSAYPWRPRSTNALELLCRLRPPPLGGVEPHAQKRLVSQFRNAAQGSPIVQEVVRLVRVELCMSPARPRLFLVRPPARPQFLLVGAKFCRFRAGKSLPFLSRLRKPRCGVRRFDQGQLWAVPDRSVPLNRGYAVADLTAAESPLGRMLRLALAAASAPEFCCVIGRLDLT